METQAAVVFRDALVGLKIMHHDMNRVHRDLKPANIGVLGTPARAVLLDVGTSAYIQPGAMLQPTPGHGGTVNYLAPEIEQEQYGAPVDIWAMGVILYELTYGQHPWRYAINPWREGRDNKELRTAFRESYKNAIERMAKDYKSTQEAPADGYIHRKYPNLPYAELQADKNLLPVGSLFVEMVRHQWAPNNRAPRPDIDDVLQHPAWGPMLPNIQQAKRRRVQHKDGKEDDGDV